jgi:DNA polymerase epsilon subunit 1
MARGSRGSFGLSSARRGTRGGYKGNSFRGGRGRGRGRGAGGAGDSAPQRDDEGTQLEERFEKVRIGDEVDEKLGFARVQEGPKREAWLINMHPVSRVLLPMDNN